MELKCTEESESFELGVDQGVFQLFHLPQPKHVPGEGFPEGLEVVLALLLENLVCNFATESSKATIYLIKSSSD